MLQFSESSAFQLDDSMCDENEASDSFIVNSGATDLDITDVMNYPVNITQTLLERIILTGPIQVQAITFPATNGRSFSESYYTKKMSNGENVKRDWLIYSKGLDSVHCFCCRIFQQNQGDTGLASVNGIKDWRHLSARIKDHELSALHIEKYTEWKSFLKRISGNKTIDSDLFKQIQQEKERLKEVFKRIKAFVLLFARQNISFQGSTSKLHDSTGRNGNFQQLIKTVATFDPVLREHIEREKNHYLSPMIQNELIAIIGAKVKTHILDCVKRSKYFSLILDGTTDITHTEQMTLVLRYVFENQMTQHYEVRENFIEFLKVHEKTGLSIKEIAIHELESLGLDPHDLRGQGYDNGSNMKGKNIGVQNLILEEYPRAFYVPCSNHSLNLVINEAAVASGANIGFFSMVEEIYTFLSASSNRWDVMKSHITTGSTLKPKKLCPTRWSSRIAAIKPLRLNLRNIIAALNEIENSTAFDDKVRHEAGEIVDKMSGESF